MRVLPTAEQLVSLPRCANLGSAVKLPSQPLHQPFPMLGRRRAQAWCYHPAYRRPAHFHAESEINLAVRGCGTFRIGRRELRLQSGDLVWLPPGLDHYLVSSSTDFEMVVAGFQPELLFALTTRAVGAPSFAKPVQKLSHRDVHRFAEALAGTAASSDSQAVEARLVKILEELNASARPAAPGLGHRAAALLQTHPAAGRDEIARKLASNRGDVSRRFHQEHGMSLNAYKNRLKILEFLRLLEAGANNLTRTALQAGFGSYSQCHRAFQGQLGTGPRKYVVEQARMGHRTRFEPMPTQ